MPFLLKIVRGRMPIHRLMFSLVALSCAVAAARECPVAMPNVVVERFSSADCDTCWQGADHDRALPRNALVLDWIVPSERGNDAPLAQAALPEAGRRVEGNLSAKESLRQIRHLSSPAGWRLKVQTGLAWNGYLALSLDLERLAGSARTFGPHASAWLALVERVPAGSDGTPVPRQLVRAVIGPLPLDSSRDSGVHHLRALRLPPNSQAERLAAAGWIEDAGQMLIASQSVPDDCATTSAQRP
ncbi:MAG TPA: hypothetical protein VFP68_19080 [Burkholderiaceae bacterium]|nr:hypothetical protein [Burkholderiaceae bacterium]